MRGRRRVWRVDEVRALTERRQGGRKSEQSEGKNGIKDMVNGRRYSEDGWRRDKCQS